MAASLERRAIHAGSKLVRHMLPPVIYFFIVFNLISFTTHAAIQNIWFDLSNFVLATTTALVVAKVVLVVDKVRLIDKFRGGFQRWS